MNYRVKLYTGSWYSALGAKAPGILAKERPIDGVFDVKLTDMPGDRVLVAVLEDGDLERVVVSMPVSVAELRKGNRQHPVFWWDGDGGVPMFVKDADLLEVIVKEGLGSVE